MSTSKPNILVIGDLEQKVCSVMNTNIRGYSWQWMNMEEKFIDLFSYFKWNNKISQYYWCFPKISVLISVLHSLVHQNFGNSYRHQEDALHNNLANRKKKLRLWRDVFGHLWITDIMPCSHITNCYTQAFLPRVLNPGILAR